MCSKNWLRYEMPSCIPAMKNRSVHDDVTFFLDLILRTPWCCYAWKLHKGFSNISDTNRTYLSSDLYYVRFSKYKFLWLQNPIKIDLLNHLGPSVNTWSSPWTPRPTLRLCGSMAGGGNIRLAGHIRSQKGKFAALI